MPILSFPRNNASMFVGCKQCTLRCVSRAIVATTATYWQFEKDFYERCGEPGHEQPCDEKFLLVLAGLHDHGRDVYLE